MIGEVGVILVGVVAAATTGVAVEGWIDDDDDDAMDEVEEAVDVVVDGPCINICLRIFATVRGWSITVNTEYITVPIRKTNVANEANNQ